MKTSGITAALPAQDLRRAKTFYNDKVALQAVESDFLEASDGRVGLMVGDGVNQLFLYPAQARSSGEFTQAVIRVSDVRAAVEQMRDRGVELLLTDALAGAGFRGYHYRLLAALAEFGAASQATLGRRTEMDRSDVVAALNELSHPGLVKRTSDPHDGRRNIVMITPTGKAELKRLDDILSVVQAELLNPLSSPERDTLLSLLTRVVAHHSGS